MEVGGVGYQATEEAQAEKRQAKRIYVDLSLENVALKDLMKKSSGARRTARSRDSCGLYRQAARITNLSSNPGGPSGL